MKNIPGVTDTMEQAWEILMHSFGALFEGKFSKTTHDGEPVSGAEAVIADNWLCSEEEGFFWRDLVHHRRSGLVCEGVGFEQLQLQAAISLLSRGDQENQSSLANQFF